MLKAFPKSLCPSGIKGACEAVYEENAKTFLKGAGLDPDFVYDEHLEKATIKADPEHWDFDQPGTKSFSSEPGKFTLQCNNVFSAVNKTELELKGERLYGKDVQHAVVDNFTLVRVPCTRENLYQVWVAHSTHEHQSVDAIARAMTNPENDWQPCDALLSKEGTDEVEVDLLEAECVGRMSCNGWETAKATQTFDISIDRKGSECLVETKIVCVFRSLVAEPTKPTIDLKGKLSFAHVLENKALFVMALDPAKFGAFGVTSPKRPREQREMEYSDGTHYVGEVNEHEIPNGVGQLCMPTGVVCTGDFVDGEAHGRALQRAPDGSCYMGEFKRGRRYGSGDIRLANGNKFSGVWADGVCCALKYMVYEVDKGAYEVTVPVKDAIDEHIQKAFFADALMQVIPLQDSDLYVDEEGMFKEECKRNKAAELALNLGIPLFGTVVKAPKRLST